MNEPQEDKPHMTRRIHLESGVYSPELFEKAHKLLAAHLKGPKAFHEAWIELNPIPSETLKDQPSQLATPLP